MKGTIKITGGPAIADQAAKQLDGRYEGVVFKNLNVAHYPLTTLAKKILPK